MMIGGKDISLKTLSGISALDCALRTIRLFWPKAIFENARTAEIIPGYRQVAFSEVHEILVYRDEAAYKRWEQVGAEPALAGTMVHMIASQHELTLVVDDQPTAQVKEIVESIRHALRLNPFSKFLEAA